VIFESRHAGSVIFKGGTSLSKCWGLIERFSEDIDLSLNRELLGFFGELSNSQVKKLKKKSCSLVSNELSEIVSDGLSRLGAVDFEVHVPDSSDSDTDPQTIFVSYPSLVPQLGYLPAKVKIEVGARALMEPIESRPIRSMVGATYSGASFSDDIFQVAAVVPTRTFLEKVFLLHELLTTDPVRLGSRLTRHWYDLERIMDTEYGLAAVEDKNLFFKIADFRRKYNAVKGIDYDQHSHQAIRIIPRKENLAAWQEDYSGLAKNMIFGQALSFDMLLDRMKMLEERFRVVAQLG
jgi:hypothetical protein